MPSDSALSILKSPCPRRAWSSERATISSAWGSFSGLYRSWDSLNLQSCASQTLREPGRATLKIDGP